MTAFKRHIIRVKSRNVHLRVGGEGPPVILLHESPRSSAAVTPLAAHLVSRATVLAPDTPGNGLSDPLPLSRPDIADYADALADLMVALNVPRAPIYGAHTGALIAMEMTLRRPDLVSCAVLEGYPVFDPAFQQEALRSYLPSFAPEWSGAHMAALWSRVRDQFIFFPWYAAGEAGRLAWPPAPLETHDAVLSDLLASGDNYRAPYAAAFRYDAVAGVARFVALQAQGGPQVTFLTRADDMLYPYLSQLRALAPDGDIRSLSADRSVWGNTISDILCGAHDAPMTAMPSQAEDRFFAGGDLLVRRLGREDGPVKLMLHGHPGSGAGLGNHTADAEREGTVLVPDLPGSGDSDALPLGPDMARRLADRLRAALPDIAMDQTAWFTAGPIAEALHAKEPARFAAPQVHDALPRDPEALATLARQWPLDLPTDWQGSHVVGAWHRARDGMLQHPWYDRSVAARRVLSGEPDLAAIHAQCAAILSERDTNAGLIPALILGS